MSRWNSILVAIPLFVSLFSGIAAQAQPLDFSDAVPNQLLVGWKEPVPQRQPGVPPSPAMRTRIQMVKDILQRFEFVPLRILMDGRAWLIESRDPLPIAKLEQKAIEIADESFVEYVAPNDVVRFRQSTPPVNDPDYSAQLTILKIDAAGAWKITTGSKAVAVAVIDTGVDVSHPDLKEQLWNNPCEIPDNGIDDSCSGIATGNGKIDDVHGWNFDSDDSDISDAATHGTAVAGIIAAHRDNEKGIAGIGDLSLAVLRTTNGTLSDVAKVVEAFDYARENGFRVATSSFTTNYNVGLKKSMELAGEAGMIIVAASGDEGKNLDIGSNNVYPASFDFDWIISVAATTDADQLKDDSNYGSNVVELAAPGVGALTTWPGGAYQAKDGSSMAVPHVVGVVGLILSMRPDATVSEVRECLAQGDPMSGADSVQWGVRLNARKAVEACRPDSDPPDSDRSDSGRSDSDRSDSDRRDTP